MFIPENFQNSNSFTITCARCKNEISHEERTIIHHSKSYHSDCWIFDNDKNYVGNDYKIPYHGDEDFDPTKLFQMISILNQRIKDMYESSANLCCQTNNNGIITDCNASFSRNMDYSKEELSGINIYELVDEKYKEFFITTLKTNWKKLENSNTEIMMKRKDGRIFPALLNVDKILDEDGNSVGFSILVRDISDIHEAKVSIERKEKLIRNQFEQLKKINLMKDEFLAMITHELKTPLVPITGYVDLLLMQHLGPLNLEQKKRLEIIKDGTQNLLKLIQDLLDVQKIELDQLKLEKHTHNLTELIEKTTVSLMLNIEQHKISITKDLQVDVFCSCDDKRLLQVLNNILVNSIDFCPKEGGQINIKLKADDVHAKVIIKDNGCGINKDKIDNLFVKFYQIDTSNTREHGGTGLGLVVCKGIIEGHGGRIWIESEGSNMGTTVSFVIPLNK